MLSEKLQEALNEQIVHELYSAYLYLAMQAHFEEVDLSGFAHWMKLQSREELEHAMKIFDFVHERAGQVTLGAIEQPPSKFSSPLEAFQQAYEHERKISQLIHKLYELAAEENDYPTQVMLHWFIEEQVEEEKITGEVVEKLKRIGDDPTGLYLLDRELGEREG